MATEPGPSLPAEEAAGEATDRSISWRTFWRRPLVVILVVLSGLALITGSTSFAPIPKHAKTFQGAEPAGADAGLAEGTTLRDPQTGRLSTVIADPSRTAVLIGDSQSGGALGVPGSQTWTQLALSSLGYQVSFYGIGGTGFVATNSRGMNYRDSLEKSKWALPYGKNPRKQGPLIVVQGGGNDARQRASDEAILANARELIADLRKDFPASRIVLIGTLAKSPAAGGGRRSAINALLARLAQEEQIPFISVGDWITRYKLESQLPDGVHLTAAGHRALVEPLRQDLKALGINGPD